MALAERVPALACTNIAHPKSHDQNRVIPILDLTPTPTPYILINEALHGFESTIKMNTISKEKAREILAHLIKTNQGFCFYHGITVDRMSLELIINGGEAE